MIVTFPMQALTVIFSPIAQTIKNWGMTLLKNMPQTATAAPTGFFINLPMSTNPSSVDMEYRRKILNNFGTPTAEDDYYYIFLIGNKKHSITAQVYDLSNNALYDSDEIDISVMTGDGKYLSDFIAEAKEVVEEKKYQATTYTGCGYQGYAKPDTKPVTTGLNAPNPNKRDGEQYDMFEELYGD